LIAGGYALYRYQYPYGYNHCCDIIIYQALVDYADKHGGAFPAGEATPEASLSLLHSGSVLMGDSAYYLAGKTRSEARAKAILDSGRLLGPDTCGWNYVEGLRIDSNPDLALFWDKEGLGHVSERLRGGGHIVRFVGGRIEHIPASRWNAFIQQQRELRAEEKRRVQDRKP